MSSLRWWIERVIVLVVVCTVATLVALLAVSVLRAFDNEQAAINAASNATSSRDAASARFTSRLNTLEVQNTHLLRNSAKAAHQRDVLNQEVKSLTRRLARDHAQTVRRAS